MRWAHPLRSLLDLPRTAGHDRFHPGNRFRRALRMRATSPSQLQPRPRRNTLCTQKNVIGAHRARPRTLEVPHAEESARTTPKSRPERLVRPDGARARHQRHAAKMIDEDDLRGLTSNPTIFEKAIGGSDDYDEPAARLAGKGDARRDLRRARHRRHRQRRRRLPPRLRPHQRPRRLLQPRSRPDLANDTERTIADAKRLFARLNRRTS